MDATWNRRQFVRTTVGALAGLGVAPVAVRSPSLRSASLPPRTVGLRTLGGNFRFDPAGLLVEPGATVTWLNMGDFHTTTAFHPRYADLLAGDVPLRIPEDAEPWHSGMLGLDAGSIFHNTFGTEGVHDYFCQPHYSFGMVGRIVVGGPRDGPAVTRPISELNEASRARMPPVDAITGPVGRSFEWASRLNGLLLLRAEEGDPSAAATAVGEGVDSDESLGRLLAGAGVRRDFDRALGRALAAVEEEAGYERLVTLLDRAKSVLAEVASA